MKKIITLIITFALIMQPMEYSAFANTAEDNISGITDILESLSIYQFDDEMGYAEDYLTRETLAVILSVFCGNERTGEIKELNGESIYSDVESGRPSAYEIMLMTGSGYLSGYTDGTFRPEGNVKLIEAMKAVIAVLGYDAQAKYYGGWPKGYKQVASELGLEKNLNVSFDDYITKGDFSKLLWNALDTEVLKTNWDYGYEKGEKLLNEIDFYEIKGILNATDKTALFGYENSDKGTVRIADTVIFAEGDFSDYLGKNVICYYKHTDDDENVLYHISVNESKNDILKVQARNISDRTTTSRFIYDDGGKEEYIDIENDVSLIFNGRRLTYFEIEHLVPQNGTVTFIDADGVKGYETIIIESYVDYLISAIHNDGNKLTIASDNMPSIVFDLSDSDCDITVKNGEETVDTSVLKQNMLISVAGDKMGKDENGRFIVLDTSKAYKILVSGSTVMGKISAVDSTDFIATIDGRQYNISNEIDSDNNYFIIGKSALFYVNAFGEISALKYLSVGDTVTYVNENYETVTITFTEGESYGFLYNAFFDEETEKISVRIFTESGEFKVFNATNTTKLDSQKYKDSNVFLGKLKDASAEFGSKTKLGTKNSTGFEQLVRYSVNSDGELASIDTLTKNYNDEVKEKDCFRFGLRLAGGDSTIAGLKDGIIHMFRNGKNIEGVVGIGDNMVVFAIPDDLSDREAYQIKKLSGDIITNPISVFDMDDFNVSKVAFQQEAYSESVPIKELNNMMVVSKIETILNKDDEPVTEVVGYSIKTGNQVRVELTEKVTNAEDIEKGDIIRWRADNLGRATVVQLTCKPDGTGTYLTAKNPAGQYYSDFRITFGTVMRISNSRILVKYTDDASTEVSILDSLGVILVVDSKNKNEVTKGDLSVVKAATYFGETDASKVFMYQDYSVPKSIVIYN